ncbi:hypothetical protein Curi_c28200 [Gottschalkia acidurici 9a]|uniref:Uncharacterized protein n=1 Tax=Gottschalkia acidurici (strain ATCC 7906 / DSM 604 / BCRC 14475 / CIP 104303 / KCTC 5404 / NCIMB 10678 / 9a) TaxID=1128398 RepID=K0B3V4_GOTA9|nr:hypothetical protein [Gottschalkia acidurici]AFS79812.1 hypothetical protein Curi_c28200 [Gottschalkia acidurici 9a]
MKLHEIPYKAVKTAINNFNQLISKAKPEQRKLFLKILVEKITVEGGKIKKIHIHFNQAITRIIDSYSNKGELGELSDESSPNFVFRIAI